MPKNRLMAFTMVSITAFLGLAVLGEGGLWPFLAHPAAIALAAFCYLAAFAAMYTAGNISSGVKEDRGNRWVLPVFGALSLAIGVLPALSDRLGFWVIGSEAVRWVGFALFAVGCVLRIWPVFVLGRRFSGLVAIQSGHELMTDGVYRYIRNPSYLGMVLTVIGWALVFRSIVGLLLALSLLIPLIPRMHAEERLLGEEFGEEYASYKARTWRLVPWVY